VLTSQWYMRGSLCTVQRVVTPSNPVGASGCRARVVAKEFARTMSAFYRRMVMREVLDGSKVEVRDQDLRRVVGGDIRMVVNSRR
jgi:hypothetical protein